MGVVKVVTYMIIHKESLTKYDYNVHYTITTHYYNLHFQIVYVPNCIKIQGFSKLVILPSTRIRKKVK